MSVRTRLAWVVVLAVLALLATTALVADRASQRIRDDLERSRGTHLLNTLRTTVETNLAIGLTLEQMSVLQALLEREKAGAADVLAIDIFAPDSTLLYSTDRGAIGAPVDEQWAQRLARAGTWQLDTVGETVLGARFDNDLGTAAGGIAVTLADNAQSGSSWDDWVTRVGRLTAIGLGAIVLALAAAVAMEQALMRPLRRVQRQLAGTAPQDIEPADTLEQQAESARRAWAVTHARVDEGMRRLREIDDAG